MTDKEIYNELCKIRDVMLMQNNTHKNRSIENSHRYTKAVNSVMDAIDVMHDVKKGDKPCLTH